MITELCVHMDGAWKTAGNLNPLPKVDGIADSLEKLDGYAQRSSFP
jgi:hypothetical protein